MNKASAAQLDIRFASIKAVSFALHPAPLADLLEVIQKRLGPNPGVYSAEPAVLNLAAWTEADWGEHQLSLAELLEPFKRAGVHVVEIQGKIEPLEEQAEALGLRYATASADAPPPAPEPEQAPLTGAEEQADALAVQVPMAQEAAPESAHAPEPPSTARKTLVVEQAVRSGQKIYAQGADLIVMGQVSAGAEVIADGNIHVYGVLRGRALAGAAGDTGARILSTCFEAELVAVAGYYLTFEGGFPEENRAKPTSIYLDHGTDPATLRLKAINIR
ncbi:MAG TPA: septum site-determining protein MinC [Limnobacter sp.]|nr:septum site-determining protein MinC [Limnobacter sp.]